MWLIFVWLNFMLFFRKAILKDVVSKRFEFWHADSSNITFGHAVKNYG